MLEREGFGDPEVGETAIQNSLPCLLQKWPSHHSPHSEHKQGDKAHRPYPAPVNAKKGDRVPVSFLKGAGGVGVIRDGG